MGRFFGFFGNIMKLTRRQEEFINTLLDLYRDMQEPVHYKTLADRLGVSPFTAYDMLRVLEEKGMVQSDYQLPSGKPGPGRSAVVFFPTSQALELLTVLAEGVDFSNWEAVKEKILERIRVGQLPIENLAEELFSRILSEEHETLRYCMEVITIIMLRLREGAGRQLLLDNLPILMQETEATYKDNLTLLGGFVLGILVYENIEDHIWCQELFEHVKQYQTLIATIDARLQQRLMDYITELYTVLQEGSPAD
jgi:hypothetical protein